MTTNLLPISKYLLKVKVVSNFTDELVMSFLSDK